VTQENNVLDLSYITDFGN